MSRYLLYFLKAKGYCRQFARTRCFRLGAKVIWTLNVSLAPLLFTVSLLAHKESNAPTAIYNCVCVCVYV